MYVWGWRTMQVILLSLMLAAGTATAAPVTTLVVTAFVSPSVLDAPMVVGIARGIFEKYGLNVQTTGVATGFEALKKVADGADLRILRRVEREHPELFRDLPPIPDTQKL